MWVFFEYCVCPGVGLKVTNAEFYDLRKKVNCRVVSCIRLSSRRFSHLKYGN